MVTWLGPWMGHAGLWRDGYVIGASQAAAAICSWLREMFSRMKGLPPLECAPRATLAGTGLTTLSVKAIKSMSGAGLVASITRPSAEDYRDMHYLDDQTRAWRARKASAWNKMEAMKTGAAEHGVGEPAPIGREWLSWLCCTAALWTPLQYNWCLSIVSPLADLHHIWLPPPPGVSEELHDWMTEIIELKREGGRLTRLKALKAQLPPPDATGAAHLLPRTMHA